MHSTSLHSLLVALLLLATVNTAAAQENRVSQAQWHEQLTSTLPAPAEEPGKELARSLTAAFTLDPDSRQLAILRQVAEQPLAAIATLEAAQPRDFPWSAPEAQSRWLLAVHAQAYALAEDDCAADPLMLPATLAQASEQISQLAGSIVRQYERQLEGRTGRRLRRHHEDALEALSARPYGLDLTRSQRRSLRIYVEALADVDRGLVSCTTSQWSSLLSDDWLQHLQTLMADHPRAAQPIIARFSTPHGEVIFQGSADNRAHMEAPLFLADLAGDDFYGLEGAVAFSGVPRFIVDFTGNDRYESAGPGAYAGGVGAIAMLLDYEGNDRYLSRELTQGAGLLGAGFLWDLAGDDYYEAGSFGQGFGLFGLGLLADSQGADRYRLGALGQGLGMPGATGMLADGNGNDDYRARGLIPTSYGTPGLSDAWAQGVGLGLRELAAGGLGMLLDRAGSDQYDAGSFAQGGGYFFGFGVHRDEGSADDEYYGTRYNFGWGAHGGLGWFEEAGGNDSYRSRHIVAAGLAWDRSIAAFTDWSGDDSYDLGDFSFGASAHESMALFLDASGSDHRAGTTPARTNQGPPNYSLFIDHELSTATPAALMSVAACAIGASISLIISTEPVNHELPRCDD